MIPVRDSLNDLNLPACKSELNFLKEHILPLVALEKLSWKK